MEDIKKLESSIEITFANKEIIGEALTHRSYLNEHPEWHLPHNERLEFLGDAVLELAVTEELFSKFPNQPEGQLTVLRAALVNYQRLAVAADRLSLDSYILMSKGERSDTSKAREVILANAMEALIGAIYLDKGYEATRDFIDKHILKYLPEIIENKSYKDAKSQLQEVVQEKMRVTPTYKVLEESGPAHRRIFRVGVCFNGEIAAEGSGMSKQEAEVQAAQEALKNIQDI